MCSAVGASEKREKGVNEKAMVGCWAVDGRVVGVCGGDAEE